MRHPPWFQQNIPGGDAYVQGPVGAQSITSTPLPIYGKITALVSAGGSSVSPSYCWQEVTQEANGVWGTNQATLAAAGTCTIPSGYVATGYAYEQTGQADVPVDGSVIVEMERRGTWDPTTGLEEWNFVWATGNAATALTVNDDKSNTITGVTDLTLNNSTLSGTTPNATWTIDDASVSASGLVNLLRQVLGTGYKGIGTGLAIGALGTAGSNSAAYLLPDPFKQLLINGCDYTNADYLTNINYTTALKVNGPILVLNGWAGAAVYLKLESFPGTGIFSLNTIQGLSSTNAQLYFLDTALTSFFFSRLADGSLLSSNEFMATTQFSVGSTYSTRSQGITGGPGLATSVGGIVTAITSVAPVATTGAYSSLTGLPTLTSGTVTSVALSPPTGISISGSPITTSGTLTLSWTSQSQNLVFASPDGSSGAPTFRAIVDADLPRPIPNVRANSQAVSVLGGVTYTVAFSSAMPSTNYSISLATDFLTASASWANKTTTGFDIVLSVAVAGNVDYTATIYQ